jgi:hypothetical protein
MIRDRKSIFPTLNPEYMKKLYGLFCLLLQLALALPGNGQGVLRDHLLFSAKLEGSQEVPAVATSATGVGSAVLNGTRDTLFVNISVTGLSGPITVAHIHEGAVGVAGPIVVHLTPFIHGNHISGYVTGADLTQATLAKYLRGQYYFNVHTSANPNGEIRGQILLESDQGFLSVITGGQETPPVTTTANGSGFYMLSHDKTKLKFMVIFEGLSGVPTAAHFHTGAAGVAGPIVSTLTTFISGNTIFGEVDPTSFLPQLLTNGVYINIHTAANLNGEIRGQLLMRQGLVFDANLTGAQEVPPVTTTARGAAGIRLNPTLDSVEFMIHVTGLSGPITVAHFHIGAVGVAGPIVIHLTPFIGGNRIGGKLSLAGLPATTISQFLKGEMYLNVHTSANPNGEIRGQVWRLAREGYTFAMNGKQETPALNVPGTGGGFVSLDRDQTNAHFMMAWSNLSGPVTAGHFHLGKMGVAGPIIFSLMPYFNNATNATSAAGYWNAVSTPAFTSRNAVQFRSDSLYVNIHTSANPGGEIRGQVFRGAKNLSRILSIKQDAPIPTVLAAYPNPSNQIFYVKAEADFGQTGMLKVSDLLGRTILEYEVTLNKGFNNLEIDLGQAGSGVYQLEFTSEHNRLVSRLVKQ